MVFYCQRKCFDKEYKTKVVSCKPATLEVLQNGKKNKRQCFEVIFDDTVLFPEGGGQPDDRGTVNDIEVVRVIRKGGTALHYLVAPLEEGTEVLQRVDWARRFDHMQQHSGQHLITAVTETLFGFATCSWYLAEKMSYIELDTPKLMPEQMEKIEKEVNSKIREGIPISIAEYDIDDPAIKEVRTRGLPDDAVGPIRVVCIEGVDTNMCCGTHVSNLSQLQAIKLLHTEKGKANKTLLYFVAGGRLLEYFGNCYNQERKLNILLRTEPSNHLFIAQKNQSDLKATQKQLREALKDLAIAEAEKVKNQTPKPKWFMHHRTNADNDYLSTIVNSIDDETILKVLTAGNDQGAGILMVHGPQHLVPNVGSKLCEIFEGRGGGKTRFTAKVNKLNKRAEAEKIVQTLLEDLDVEN
ncbi:alanyl-tRNA editing protein Aarsd1-B [Oratosquilla oratoria]|uniref:alanyl-tRNA editing protein Aarsd1-B n=1 Tax=Oratosquilla oratoria TaxID=337810 RepID=UPI003F76C281